MSTHTLNPSSGGTCLSSSPGENAELIGVVGRGGVNTSLLILCVGSDIIRAGVDGLVGGGVLGLSSLVGRVWGRFLLEGTGSWM